MSLPPELLAPPPRSGAAAEPFLRKTQKTAMGMILGGFILLPVLVAIFWLNFGEVNVTTILICVGISSLVDLMGVALVINSRKSLQLFREGIAVLGRVRAVKAADGSFRAVEVEFLGGKGTMQVGSVVLVGALDVREGAPMPVLYSLSDPRRFAIYTPSAGMMAGVIKS